jgi:hypothetical protein
VRLLIVPALALLALGAEGLFNAFRGRTTVAVDCAELARARPPSNRLLVTGCEIDFAGAGYQKSGQVVTELFFPARPAGQRTRPKIVLATRASGPLKAAQTVLASDQAAPLEQSRALREQLARLFQSAGAIDGLARAGVIERARSRRILSGLPSPVSDDAVILDLGGTPDFIRPLLALAGGVLLAFVSVGRKPRTKPRPETVAAAAPPERPPVDARFAADPIALPRLLLLNLGAAAGPDAIELAPPLGERREVVRILCAAVPDLRSGPGGVLARSDNSLTLDSGSQDPVAAVAVDARGEAGVALVKEILLTTGWRAFAPKTGLFVSVDELAAIAALARSEPS